MKALRKNVLLAALALVLAIGLAACGKEAGDATTPDGNGGGASSDNKRAETIELTLWDQSVGATDPSAKLIPEIVDEWNKANPHIQVKRTGTPGEQYKTKIKTALAANEAPDIFYGMGGGSFMQPYIENGNVLDITSYVTDEVKARIKPGVLETLEYEGKLYTLPVYTHIANLYINTELFEKAGADIPTTYTELLDAVKKLRAAGITPAVVGEKDRWPGMYWFNIIALRQAGYDAVVEAFHNPSKWNSPDIIEAARKLQELANAGMFNDSMFSMSYEEMLGAYNAGNAAMMFQANWVNAGIEDPSSATSGKVVVVPFPVFEDGKGTAHEFLGGSSDGFYISANTKHPDEAYQFLLYLSEQLGTRGFLAGAGLPTWSTEGLDTSSLSQLDLTFAELMDTAEAFIPWWDNVFPASSADTHKNLIAQLLAGEITPEQFAEQMAQLEPTELHL